MLKMIALAATAATAEGPLPPDLINRPPPPVELAMGGRPPKGGCEYVIEFDENGKKKRKLKCEVKVG